MLEQGLLFRKSSGITSFRCIKAVNLVWNLIDIQPGHTVKGEVK